MTTLRPHWRARPPTRRPPRRTPYSTGTSFGTFWLWATNESCNCNIYVQGPGERRTLRILDVDGQRIVVFHNYFDGTSEADRAEAQAIIDSITIEP